MNERKFEITDARGGAAVGIRVVTKAAATELVGKNDDGTLKVRLQASPASDPAANAELIEFIAAQLGVEKEKIEVVAGANSRDKILSIEGLSTQEVEERLLPLV
ncbi:MAG: DUF167 domain-containing protein [Anaerolineae bacterium]|nr:DUF167 domain-containing protein [Anaerolineae bacterium]